jgi:dTDP-4-amino-4,6-dideoxygalactose transaminase
MSQRIPFVDLARQYAAIREEADAAVRDVLESTSYILGEEVSRFEDEWAAFTSTQHCVGVASGTAALELAYEAVGIGAGDEVIAPANTFFATVSPILRRGARPVLVDCDEHGQIDVEHAAQSVTPRTRAVVGVHLYGHPCDADTLEVLCDENGLVFVEDAAQAHGAQFRARRCGSLGRIAAFSFYPAKNLGAYGDAGAVTTNDEHLAEAVRLARDLGQRVKYEHVAAAGNERLDTLQAAVLRVKLRHLPRWNERRAAHAERYSRLLDGAVQTPPVAVDVVPSWHLYVVRVANRDEVRDVLAAEGISSGIHYPIPLHLQPALSSLGYGKGSFPVTEEWARTQLSLPMFPELAESEIERVAEVVRRTAVAALA